MTPADVPPALVRDFDHIPGEPFTGDPASLFEPTRGDRVFWSPHHGGYWVLTRMADIRDVLRRPHQFSSWPVGFTVRASRRERMLPLELDPPEHAGYRRLLAPIFAPKAVTARAAEIDAVCAQLIDSLASRGRCDLISKFARPFPAAIFTSMLGLPVEHAERFLDWNNALLHARGDPDARRQAGAHIHDYLRDVVDQRRRVPRADLITALLHSRVHGRPVEPVEVRDLAFTLFVAGLDTVTSALAFAFRFLAENPGHRHQLVSDPDRIPAAVEELLRAHSFINMARTVTEDTLLAGVRMRPGERVLLSTALAGNDPDEFDDPAQVRLDRPANRHLAFGTGPHHCPGAHLARAQLAAALRYWHRRIPDYALAEDQQITMYGGSVMGIERLELRWPTRRAATDCARR